MLKLRFAVAVLGAISILCFIARTRVAPDAGKTSGTNSQAESAAHDWLRPCNIERKNWPQHTGKLSSRSPEPYIVRVPAGWNSEMRALLEKESLLESMGDMECTPSQSANVRRGIIPMQLREYIEDWMTREISRDPSENRYVFGEFGDQWAPLRDAYQLPPCRSCTRDRVAITIGLGGLHSGAPWHFHDAAFVEVFHGEKHFALLPLNDPAVPLIDEAMKNLSQLHWYREEMPRLLMSGHLQHLYQCTIRPGDILYFPPYWHHGVVNLKPYTAFVSTFLDREAQDEL